MPKKNWKISDGPKHPEDIPITDPMPYQEANAAWMERAKMLRDTGYSTDKFGTYVAKHGDGHAVFLTNREITGDSFDVSDQG